MAASSRWKKPCRKISNPPPPIGAGAPRKASRGRSARRPNGSGTTSKRDPVANMRRSRSASLSTSLSKRGDTSWIDASRRRSRAVRHAAPMWLAVASFASPLTKLHLRFRAIRRLSSAMRIVDVCAFYTPAGGGVRTYVDAKLRAAARFGHESRGHCSWRARRGGSARSRRVPRHHPLAASCRSTAAMAISTTRKRFTACSTHGGRTMSKRLRPGRARRWSAAGRAMPPARWSCIRTRLAAYAYRWLGGLPRSRRSIAGSAGSGATCAASATCSTRWYAPIRSLPSACAGRSRPMPRRSRWASKAAFSLPRLRSPEIRAAALETLGLDADATIAGRRRALVRREALGHGDPRGRATSRASASDRADARRRRAEAPQAREPCRRRARVAVLPRLV